MSANEIEMADALEQYLDELEANPNAEPPRELDAQMIATVKKMNAHFDAPEPEPAFVASLREQIDGAATHIARTTKTSRKFFAQPRWSFVGVGAALVIAFVALLFFATRPPSVNAQELLNNARSAASDLNSVKVKSFEMTQTSFDLFVDDPNTTVTRATQGETKTWYAGPTRWRIETKSESPNQPTYQALTVADGDTQWDYNATDNTVNIQVAEEKSFPSPSVLSLDLLQEDMSYCYDPKVVGEETIAGRASYKVYLGPAKCRSASIWWLNGPHTIWLDKETFFVLKSEIRAENSDQISSKVQVTAIRYNLDLPNDLFSFTPPADAKINDMRPQPAPSASANSALKEYQTELRALAPRVEFPIFAPSSLPNGLVPLAPNWNEFENQIELGFVPPAQIGTNSLPDTFGILIYEKRADYELVRNWTDGAERIEINGNEAWVRRGDFDPASGTGSNSAVMMVRDGVLISISSFRIAPEQLLDVAKSLEMVQGSHAPLPNPLAPTLAEIRAQSDFPFFIPTYVPEDLTARPPTSHQLEYQRADGTVALIVMNAKQGEGGMEQDTRFQGERVNLKNGIAIHQLGFEPQIIILWWHQENGYVSLEGHGISQEEMLKIAESMSSTAELK